jgi:hypothetical protein
MSPNILQNFSIRTYGCCYALSVMFIFFVDMINYKLVGNPGIMLIKTSTSSHLVNTFCTYIVWTSTQLHSMTITA